MEVFSVCLKPPHLGIHSLQENNKTNINRVSILLFADETW